MVAESIRPEDWASFKSDVIRSLQPGTITEIIIHLAHLTPRCAPWRPEAAAASRLQLSATAYVSKEGDVVIDRTDVVTL